LRVVDSLFSAGEPPTDDDILSLWQMIVSPDHLRWEPPDNPVYADKSPVEVLDLSRTTLLPRATHQACWARAAGQIVGRATILRYVEEGMEHCGEIGFAVRAAHRGRGSSSVWSSQSQNRGGRWSLSSATATASTATWP